jgi:hypothetical protein
MYHGRFRGFSGPPAGVRRNDRRPHSANSDNCEIVNPRAQALVQTAFSCHARIKTQTVDSEHRSEPSGVSKYIL